MPDIQFDFGMAKKDAASLAQRQAVLWPIMGRKALFNDMVIEDSKRLLTIYRNKLSALKEVGWSELQEPGRLQFARNCPIELVTTNNGLLMPCNLTGICPWDFARDVEMLFDRFAAFLPNRGQTILNPLKLLEVSNSRIMPAQEAGACLDAHLKMWQTVPKKLIDRLKTIGAYYGVYLEPYVKTNQHFQWKFKYRILAMVPVDWEPPKWLYNNNRKVRMYIVQSKKQLVSPIARTCRYPTGMMLNDENLVMRALNARRGLKCKTLTGKLRGVKDKKKNHVEFDDQSKEFN